MNLKKFFLIIIFISGWQLLSGQTRQELEDRREKTRNEIENTTRILEQVSRNKGSSLSKIRVLNRQIGSRKRLIDELVVEQGFIQIQIDDNEYVINALAKDVEKIKEDYANLLSAAYKQRPPYFELTYIFASRDINQAYKRFKYLQQYSDYRKRQVHLILQIEDLLIKKNRELVAQKAQKQNIIQDIESERTRFNIEVGEQQNQIRTLQGQEKSLQRKLQEQRRMAQRLDEEIKRIIAEEASKNRDIRTLTPEQKIISENFESNKGRIPWPTRTGIITEKFGEHPHPVFKNVKERNDGVNITTTEGSEARAVFEGEVVKVFAIPGANQTVILRHGNYLTVYHNLINVRVKVGDKVNLKQGLGTIYTDREEDNQTTLTFMVWKERQKLNPELWISK